MRKVFLVCNAHIDPIWQWQWDEGTSSAISTFQSAVNLLEKHDYIFCHNESVLYSSIEEYTPDLFKRIKKLVKHGKWIIMGGWFLQPDCNLPQGESICRQIQTGKSYFKKKFNKFSKVAINFDPFGHSIGIVQIIKKCGQDAYVFMRPEKSLLKLEDDYFIWKGLDGSEIKAYRVECYGSQLGKAREYIEKNIKDSKDDFLLIPWGVGNHGGGPSDKDLSDIEDLIQSSSIEIVHSSPDDFFNETKPKFKFEKSLHTSFPGCYSSLIRLKQKHIELENKLYYTEKLLSYCALKGLCKYPIDTFKVVVKDLLNSEFHDTLPGSCIESGEQNGFEFLNHGLHELDLLSTYAMFMLTSVQPQAEDGEFPVLVFNPHPYSINHNIVVELSLKDPNWDDFITELGVYYEGVELPSQVIKEQSNLNLDWRKRIVFNAELKPFSEMRFSIREKQRILPKENVNDCFEFKSNNKYVRIGRDSGLIENYCIDGKEYLNGKAFCPVMFDDTADSWGGVPSCQSQMGDNPVDFRLSDVPSGIFKNLKSIEIIENGDVYLGIESFFELNNSKIRLEYKIFKNNPDVEINGNLFLADNEKIVKLRLPIKNKGAFIGQCPFGTELLDADGKEQTAQRFIAVRNDDKTCLALLNKSVYAFSYKDDNVFITLARSAGFCTQAIQWPIGSYRKLLPDNKYVKYMDQGMTSYSFCLTVCNEDELQSKANEFNQKPYALNVFPTNVNKKAKEFDFNLSNSRISLECFKKSEQRSGYVIRLLNNFSSSDSTILTINGKSIEILFNKYEVKTFLYKNNKLIELDEMII